MTAEEFFAEAFFASLEADYGQSAPRTPPASAVMSDLWGVALPPSLARFVDYLAGTTKEIVRRPFFASAADADWLPPVDDACRFMLAEWFRRAGMLTTTIPIGCTGDGDIWLFEVSRERTRVALLDHDTMAMTVVADSIESFALLVSLLQTGGDWSPLAGRVRRHDAFELPDDLVELPPEAGADLAARADDVDELLGCLWYGHEPNARPPVDRCDAASMIEQMLRAFLRGEDPLPAGAVDVFNHPARLVRSTARFLEDHKAVTDRTQRWQLLDTD
ncbi:MAG TPA: SMI1/KNR4 family protein [Polyangia bacterium]|nr:SMI1/KNR4 family protein [Polyangia bacterium]